MKISHMEAIVRVLPRNDIQLIICTIMLRRATTRASQITRLAALMPNVEIRYFTDQ